MLDRQPQPVDESGFTLLEMVVAVVILVLITGAISAAFVTSIKSSQSTKHVVNASQDAQLISGLFTRDAQAAGGTDPATGTTDPTLGVTTPAPNGSFNNGCSAPGTPLIGFKWIDQSSDAIYEANYSYVASPTGTYVSQQFLRTVCSTPPGGSTSTPATSVLANNVVTTATGSLAVPAAWCDDNQGQSPPATCPVTPPSTAAFPNTASISMTILNTTANVTSPYPFSLTANVRPQSNLGPDFSNPNAGSPLMLLGGTSGCANGSSLNGGGNAKLTVYGIGAINGCPDAASLSGSSAGGSTDRTYVAAPATCAGIDPQCSVVSEQFLDPFAPLIANGTVPTPSTAGCAGNNNPAASNGHYSPGTYPKPLNANNATFDPGTYVFCNGLQFSGTVTGNNVTFYFAGGTITGSNGSSITLTQPTTGPYAPYKLTVWQAQGDSTQPTTCCSNNSGTYTIILGTMYAPSAYVSFKNATVHIDQLVAIGLDMSPGTGGTTIGNTPVVTSVSPSSRGQGALNEDITINGANFYNGASLASDFGAGITVNSTTYVSSTQLTANITIAANATVGSRDVTVTNGSGHNGTLAGAFNVSQGPGVTTATPNSYGRGLTNQNVVIAGTNFVNGAQATFSGAGITVNSTAFNNVNQLTAKVTIAANATIGTSDVTVTNPDGGRATASNAFAVVAPAIVSVTLVNGANPNVAGTIERNDRITIVFSSQMDESDICSTWTNDNNNQNLNQAGDVVTLTDGGVGNDTITASATACTFNIGTIDLGSPAFVTGGNATFGSGGSNCVFAWNAATHTLTITLGAKAGIGVIGNVPGNVTPVYNASAISDSGGAALTNSPFTLPNGKQF